MFGNYVNHVTLTLRSKQITRVYHPNSTCSTFALLSFARNSIDMDDLQISRIVLESEGGWNRIKGNVDQALGSAMEMRLASLPGGKDGEMSRRVRKEVEVRIAKVNFCRAFRSPSSWKIREDMWEKTTHNLRINGHDYEDFIQGV